MKKTILIAAIFTAVQCLQGQAEPILKSRKGHYILPQTNDLGLGINADPMLRYMGNMFNQNATNTPPVFEPGNLDQSITFKKFIDEKNAWRAGLLLQNNYTGTKFDVRNLNPDAAANAVVNDFVRTSIVNIMLSGGREYRRGSSRLQGIIGYKGMLGYSTGNRLWRTYGNRMVHYKDIIDTFRVIKQPQSAPSFTFGASGFVGVEYFFAPKMSIGGTFFLSAMYSIDLPYSTETEIWDNNNQKSVIRIQDINNRQTNFNVSTHNAGGNLQLMFYF
jgi:hypothetical protein